MKINGNKLFMVLCVVLCASIVSSQTNHEQILKIRTASNAALKSYDNEKVLSFLSDDVVTTTGNGTLLCGKEELEKYILAGGPSKMYWIRDSKEIVVNTKRGLAWESGIWNGYNPEIDEEAIITGNYTAMWTKASGIWKIKSQLFVTIDEK